MLIDKFLDKTTPGLVEAMNLTWKRGQAIASNVANAETPGYRAVDLNFSNELERAFNLPAGDSLLKTNKSHLDTSDPQPAHMVEDLSGVTKPDGNNVDIDSQMGRLAYNSGRYAMAANVLRKQLSVLKAAIRSVR